MAEGLSRLPPYEWPEGYRAAAVFSADVDVESPYQWANRGKAPERFRYRIVHPELLTPSIVRSAVAAGRSDWVSR